MTMTRTTTSISVNQTDLIFHSHFQLGRVLQKEIFGNNRCSFLLADESAVKWLTSHRTWSIRQQQQLAGRLPCCPTNNVKALKRTQSNDANQRKITNWTQSYIRCITCFLRKECHTFYANSLMQFYWTRHDQYNTVSATYLLWRCYPDGWRQIAAYTIVRLDVHGFWGRGRPKKRWIDNIWEDCIGIGIPIQEASHTATNRERWRNITTTTTTTTVLRTFDGTTRVSRYQKKHSPTHHPGHHPIFISFFHLPWSTASSLFKDGGTLFTKWATRAQGHRLCCHGYKSNKSSSNATRNTWEWQDLDGEDNIVGDCRRLFSLRRRLYNLWLRAACAWWRVGGGRCSGSCRHLHRIPDKHHVVHLDLTPAPAEVCPDTQQSRENHVGIAADHTHAGIQETTAARCSIARHIVFIIIKKYS